MAAAAASSEAQLHWLALHLTPGLGARSAYRLVQIFGHAERIMHASASEIHAAVPRLPKAVVASVEAGIAFEDAALEQRKAEAAGAVIITIDDPRYPDRLKEIDDPPILLYALGRTDLLKQPSVAVVGTRRPTPYGRAAAEKLSRDIVELGVTHVSGMARGVDACSHRGALAGGGDTVAVLGTGVDRPYPRENQKLYREILERGLVVSQFRMGESPFAQNFPKRNRIIAGVSYATLVVEGAQYSGSLITARLAMEQNREVLAIPGPITSKPSWGPNLLIRDGAKLVQEATDIVEELPYEVRLNLKPRMEAAMAGAEGSDGGLGDGAEAGDGHSTPAMDMISAAGRKVFRVLRVDEAVHIDAIIRECGDEPPAEVLAALSELELFGGVRQMPGKYFVRTWND